ncbi:TSUP family transporter, partial [Streptomyces diastaticus]
APAPAAPEPAAPEAAGVAAGSAAPGTGEAPGTGRGARLKARTYGVLGGFTTMVANAGGPVMSLYLLSAGFRKLGFLGTSAWFFLIVNTSKVPFSVGLGLIDGPSLLLDAVLVLLVVPGALLGRALAHRINQVLFERLVLAATVAGGVQLLLLG